MLRNFSRLYISVGDRSRGRDLSVVARIALAIVCLWLAQATRAVGAEEQDWREAVQKSRCLSAPLDREGLLLVAAGWRGRGLADLLAAVGIDRTKANDHDGGVFEKLNPADQGRIAGKLFALTQSALKQFVLDVAKNRNGACAVVVAQVRDADGQALNLDTVLGKAQAGLRYEPYLELAQFLLKAQGCYSGKTNGLYNEEFADAWAKAAAFLQLPAGSPGEAPTPSDVARLVSQPYSAGQCSAKIKARQSPGTLATLAHLFRIDTEKVCESDSFGRGQAAIYDELVANPPLGQVLDELQCEASQPILYRIYVDGLTGKLGRVLAARILLTSLGFTAPTSDQTIAPTPEWSANSLVRTHFVMGAPQMVDLAHLAELITSSDAVFEAVRAEANRNGKSALGTALIEGLSDGGQVVDAGLTLLSDAATSGDEFATLRLAQLHENGLGVPRDVQKATAYYAELARRGEPAGLSSLARINEDAKPGDLSSVARLYSALLASLPSERSGSETSDPSSTIPALNYVKGISTFIQSRIMVGSPFLATRDGLALLLASAKAHPDLAYGLGEIHACVDCGAAVDLKSAVRWYRLAASALDQGNPTKEDVPTGALESSFQLARILMQQPQLAESGDEARKLMEKVATLSTDSTDPTWTATSYLVLIDALARSREANDVAIELRKRLDRSQCDEDANSDNKQSYRLDCVSFAHLLAIGALDARFVAIGYDYLKSAVDAAFKSGGIRDESGRIVPAVPAYIDVLAFYGDFESAGALLRHSGRSGWVQPDTVSAYEAVVRRLISVGGRRDSPRMTSLLGFLEAFAARGSASAGQFKELLMAAPERPRPQPDPNTYSRDRALYELQLARGGPSKGLAASAHRLADAERYRGDRNAALGMERQALYWELEIDKASAIFEGPLPAALARTCHLSRSSRRIFDLGFDDVALYLAKTAVNELQVVRRHVRSLPERLQLCFSDVVSDQYRWLIDLLIRLNSPAEAEYVIGMLKDFEKFEFLGREATFEKRAFDGFAISEPLQETQRRLGEATVSLTALAGRQRELQIAQNSRPLTDQETSQFNEIRVQLAGYEEQSGKLISDLIQRASAVRNEDAGKRLQILGSIQGRLRNELRGAAAAIHYVVLPDRMDAILTLPYGPQLTYVWDKLDGKPFSEAALDSKVEKFRTLLQNPRSDPTSVGQEFFELLFAPFAREIAESGVKTLLVSLDRKLRYIPFAALYDGKSYLAERLEIISMTVGQAPAGRAISSTSLDMSAFGMTSASQGLPALSAVKFELDGLTKDASGKGLFKGHTWVDKSFTRKSLSNGLVFGMPGQPSTGIVHVASHFNFGRTESESFLLLGSGDRLSIREIKDHIGPNREFDFGDVELLTLSACNTAYGEVMEDGRQLESFAALAEDNGVRSALGTLWPVNDRGAAAFIHNFYGNVVNPSSSREAALKATQLLFIKDRLDAAGTSQRGAAPLVETKGRGSTTPSFLGYSHPYYWAPFVLLEGVRGH
ncbi:CHAT domain-containing protein/TPR repeat protein [Bradyrhizobium sp. USDA 4341]